MVNKARPIKHGTIGGYVTHRRRGETPCGFCRKAWRIYYQRKGNKTPEFLRKRSL